MSLTRAIDDVFYTKTYAESTSGSGKVVQDGVTLI